MADERPAGASWIARALQNPPRLRRRGYIGLAIAAGLMMTSALAGGVAGAFLLAAGWVISPAIAMMIGAGDAFFLQHGRGQRRVMLTVVGAIALAIGTCVALAGLSTDDDTTSYALVQGALLGGFLAGMVLGMAAIIALAVGRGSDYAANRIAEMSEEDW